MAGNCFPSVDKLGPVRAITWMKMNKTQDWPEIEWGESD